MRKAPVIALALLAFLAPAGCNIVGPAYYLTETCQFNIV